MRVGPAATPPGVIAGRLLGGGLSIESRSPRARVTVESFLGVLAGSLAAGVYVAIVWGLELELGLGFGLEPELGLGPELGAAPVTGN